MTDTPRETPCAPAKEIAAIRSRLISALNPSDGGLTAAQWYTEDVYFLLVWAVECDTLREEAYGQMAAAKDRAVAECNTLRAQLAEARDRLSAAEHERSLMAADTQRGITDCSTPIFQRVRNIVEYLAQAEAQLAAREGEIATLTKENSDAYEYLARLFECVAPQCSPHTRLTLLCTQIDNYIAGCHAKLAAAEARADTAEAQLRAQERNDK